MIEKIQSTIHRQLHEIYQQIALSNHQISQNAASKLDRPWAICLLTSPRNTSRNRRGATVTPTMQNIWQKQEEIWIRKVGYSEFQSYIPHQPSQGLMILIAHLVLLSCLEFGIMRLPLHLKPVLSEQEIIFVNLNTIYI